MRRLEFVKWLLYRSGHFTKLLTKIFIKLTLNPTSVRWGISYLKDLHKTPSLRGFKELHKAPMKQASAWLYIGLFWLPDFHGENHLTHLFHSFVIIKCEKYETTMSHELTAINNVTRNTSIQMLALVAYIGISSLTYVLAM